MLPAPPSPFPASEPSPPLAPPPRYMAAGVIPIAHDSGGPRADIVVPLPLSVTDAPPTQSMVCEGNEGNGRDAQITGYLASSVEEYTVAITEVRVGPGMTPRSRAA